MNKLEIERVKNGYIVRGLGSGLGETEVFASLDDVLGRLLTYYEGLSTSFTGDKYGRVSVVRGWAPRVVTRAEFQCPQVPKYSGEYSKMFWNRVNSLPEPDRDALYGLGVALQNLEGDVLRQLTQAEDRAKTGVAA